MYSNKARIKSFIGHKRQGAR